MSEIVEVAKRTDHQRTQVIREDDRHRITSTIWRRHTARCAQRYAGRKAMNCDCPIWADGCVNSVRVFRKSLQIRNVRIARTRLSGLVDEYFRSLEDQAPPVKDDTGAEIVEVRQVESRPSAVTLPEGSPDDPCLLVNASEAFISSCITNGVKPPTIRKYRNSINKLREFTETDKQCTTKNVRRVADLGVIDLDRFRASRRIAPITSSKELETLRQFWAFCTARELCPKNIAALIKGPKIVDQNDVVPHTQEEVQAIIDACGTFGQYDYERKRARAIVLTLRYTALRISDVALLRRDRISPTEKGWRIFVRTTKNNALVFLLIPGVLVEALNALPAPRGSDRNCPYFFWNGKSKPKSQISEVSETLAAVFRKSGVANCHAHKFRHTLATDLLGAGATFEEVADVLGNSPEIVRKHYAKWSTKRQERIDDLVQTINPDAWKRDAQA